MLLTREWIALALFFSILGALGTIAWISHDIVDAEIESKVFNE